MDDRRSLFSVLSLRDFRRVWIAEVISDVGNFITFIALAVFIHDLTGKTVAVGLALALRSIPWFTFGPLAGVVVDRVDRRVVMVACDIARAVLVAMLAFTHTVGQAYVIAFVSGCFSPFFRPARQALLPNIAPGDDYVRALGLSEVAHQGLHTIGPALGGAAVLVVGARHAFLIDAATFVVSALTLIGISHRAEPHGRPRGLGELWRDLTSGGRMLWGEPVLRSLVASRSAVVIGEAGLIALLVTYVRDGLHRGAGSYGLALALGGIGTASLSFLLARQGGRVRRSRLLLVGAMSPVVLIPTAWHPGFALLLALMFVKGAAVTGLALYDDVVMAERTPDTMRGRVFSLSGATTEAAEFGGSLGFAALGDAIGAGAGIAVSAAAACVLGVLSLLPALPHVAADDDERLAGIQE